MSTSMNCQLAKRKVNCELLNPNGPSQWTTREERRGKRKEERKRKTRSVHFDEPSGGPATQRQISIIGKFKATASRNGFGF
jgi:hypothetical protein